MLTRLIDGTFPCDTTSTFRGEPIDTMDHGNNSNNNEGRGNTGLASFSQTPLFTADQLQAMYRQSQQRSNVSSGRTTAQQSYSSMNDTSNQNWMQMLQPTPLGGTNQQTVNQSSQNREMQLMLQQLFQDQRNQEGNHQATSLFTLGSTVEPMHHHSAPANESEPDFFKTMWDMEDTTGILGKPPTSFQSTKAATKRKWTTNGGITSSANVIMQNQASSNSLGNPSLQAEQSFSFPLDAMDDSEDFSLRYGSRDIREESPMSMSSGVGVPPTQELLPTSLLSSSRGLSNILEKQPASEQQQLSRVEESNTVPLSEEEYAFLLPSTLLPPSVMASVLHPGVPTGMSAKTSASSGGGRYKKKKGTKSTRLESPLDALQRILSLQGYGPITRIPAEDAQYETVPSPLQLASFGTELIKAIHALDTQHLSKLLETGLSPNPCNKFRDSMIDLVCKRANGEIFKCLVNHGCDLRVCDGFGRTPLHHCCWASEFSPIIAETILEIDWLQIFIEDKRGQIPLEYIRPDQAAEWVEFLEDNRQRLFPPGGRSPTLLAVKDYRPDNVIPDPPNALPIELASAISSGRLTPDDLSNMDPSRRAKFR